MRKIIITILCIMILSPFATFTAQAADTKSTSIAIPITTGLTGAANSTKSFTLDLPSGVASTSIKTGTLKYNGNNAVVGNISVVNGKLHLTLKGMKEQNHSLYMGMKIDGRIILFLM